MALKFLNKKGWHTGSLRNIENVWKAEQKHDAEQKKLEELRKQIQEEREKSEFRLLQEQAGLVPRQERLDFLYESGLSVGKGSSDGFKALEALPKPDSQSASSSSGKQQSVPGALFEEKPQSANDAWRKLHSDPLLLIRQREQEALARVKNNPVQMAMIRKSIQAEKQEEDTSKSKKSREKRDHKKAKCQKHSLSESQFDAEEVAVEAEERRHSSYRKSSKNDEHSNKVESSERESREKSFRRKRDYDQDRRYKETARGQSDLTSENGETHNGSKRNHDRSKRENCYSEGRMDAESGRNGREDRSSRASVCDSSNTAAQGESQHKRRNAPKLSEEERAARLQEMQMDAELHEQQRWKRIKKAAEDDAQEAIRARMSGSRNFLDATQRSVYGAEKGGSTTVEESVRRRTHYSQRGSDAGEGNAFRR